MAVRAYPPTLSSSGRFHVLPPMEPATLIRWGLVQEGCVFRYFPAAIDRTVSVKHQLCILTEREYADLKTGGACGFFPRGNTVCAFLRYRGPVNVG